MTAAGFESRRSACFRVSRGGRHPPPGSRETLAKPEAHRGWSHRLFDRTEQVCAKRVEIDLVAQPVGECLNGARGVITRAVEAAIDGVMVNGTAAVAAGAGNILRRIQSGNLRSYAAWVLLGTVVWLAYILLRP